MHEKTMLHDELRHEKTKLHGQFAEEIRKIKSENINLKCELQKKTKDLEEFKSQNDPKQRTLLDEMEVDLVEVPVEVDIASSAEINALRKELEEKIKELEKLQSLCNCLIVKENLTNQELLDARKESIQGLKDILNSRTSLGVKKMGEIDKKAFDTACSLKFPNEDWQLMSAELCSLWENNIIDSNWHPFKTIPLNGNEQEVVDEDDEKLKQLRNEYDKVAFDAVSTALLEMNEYNPSGRYPVDEIWNLKEGRKARMKEIIEYLIKQLKTHKCKRKR